uniref:PepSY-associated TM helix domain-containing protein n=1 Tax=uncultured Aquincola sp. TaxID=886556 RepID=UPI0032B15AE3
MSQQRLPETGSTAWSLTQARVPQSQVPQSSVADDHAGHAGHQGHEAPAAPLAATAPAVLGVDAVMARVQHLGLAPGYSVSLPAAPTGVFTAAVYPRDVAQQRVVHLDAYSGAVLLDMGYADYGPLGRWLEWGINVHLGQEYGVPNQAVLVLACLAIVLLCVSAAVMWWKRRPARALGVPPAPADPRVMRGLLALLAAGGLLFPLVGASLLVMAALDRLLAPRLLPPTEPR